MIFRGIVNKYSGRGRDLGYPTANIDVPADAEEGVFFGYTTILPERSRRPSLIFIGVPETFGGTTKRLETHILDFSGDLYGKEIELQILKKLRDNQKFESAEALIEQMKIDELAARKYFGI